MAPRAHNLSRARGDTTDVHGPLQRLLDCTVTSAMRQAPRWVAASVAGAVKADDVSIRVVQVGFPPEPTLISRRSVKDESPILELLAGCIEVRAFEIYDHAGVLGNGIHPVEREGRRTDGAFEASVGR